MTYETYKLIHLSGLILLFLGLGAILSAGRAQSAPGRKAGLALHGLGMLAMLVAGFGLQARLYGDLPAGTDKWPWWLFGKIGAWVLLALLPFAVKRGYVPASVGWLVAIAAGAAAAWLAVAKPS